MKGNDLNLKIEKNVGYWMANTMNHIQRWSRFRMIHSVWNGHGLKMNGLKMTYGKWLTLVNYLTKKSIVDPSQL